MSRALVIYGTTDGHTARIAHMVAGTLESHGCRVDVRNAKSSSALSPEPYDAVIVAASLHTHKYQKPVRAWATRYAAILARKPTAFISVCLAILEKDPAVVSELGRILSEFERAIGWIPSEVKIVAGALPWTRYGWLRRLVMKRLVARTSPDTDTSRDYEYTDWDALLVFVLGFAERNGLVPEAVFSGVSR